MNAQLILGAKQFKINNPEASLNLETCRFNRLKELINDSGVFVRRIESGLTIKVFYYA